MKDKDFRESLNRERELIDRIDAQLLPLFIQRMQCSERVAEIKGAAGLPVLNAQREQEILDRVNKEAGDYGGSAAALFQSIMAISRARQHQMLDQNLALRDLERQAQREFPHSPRRLVCQGVRGAYSHRAARSLFGEETEIQFVPDFDQVFQEVDTGALGVLPVENSAAGSVTAVYDLILQYRFFIIGAVDIKVEHCLAATEENDTICTVLSHPHALAQCSDYIGVHKLQSQEFSNTAAAAQYVAQSEEKGLAAICSKEAAQRYGLVILKQGIQNTKNNTTRFVAISKEAIFPQEANKISLCFSIPHTTGSLYNVLQRFAVGGLNLTKIESRPIPDRNFEYDFYLDFTGSIHHSGTLDLICALNSELPRFSFLGNYSEFRAKAE